MAKSKAKPAAKAVTEASPAPKKGRRLKLILFACLPLVLGGGGYAGWTFYMASSEAAHGGETAEGHGTDATKVAAIPPEIAAENSFTYSFALSHLLKRMCGGVTVKALKTASEAEALADGNLVNLSWIAANRRLDSITEESCSRMMGEIGNAEMKAEALEEPVKDEKSGGHH